MRGQGLGVGTVESQSQAIWMFLSLLELIKDITAMKGYKNLCDGSLGQVLTLQKN